MSITSAMTSAVLRLPPGLRILAVVFSGAGLMVGAGLLVMYIRQKDTGLGPAFWIVATIVITVLIAAIIGISRMVKKRKVKQADEAVRQSAAGGSSRAKDPDEIARLDQMRKDFLAAYERFCEHNDEGIYSLPFLLLVGEPASGKTEAIRHSNVNFPAGLNKPQAGAGGTYNMDWWFTNDAIVIDSAGRILFEETPEWNELLRQLNRVRPHCPINGLLLVIPADSLLQDSAEEIEQKADRIAQQINIIKRELGIRFPVFVIITKSDLITGFREFFTHLNDPALQHQILGWSNPADIDDPFNPELVDRHLEQVQERLRRRRLSLLFEPPEIDYSGRRADQVDALYAFPEEFMRIKSRLQLYMEKVFTPGPWTRRPPFVRGIYFTSSMQEGQEIDTALAEMLGVSVKELPEGRTWQKDKAYFLKDLFLQKVFPEQGLVTRAANAAKSYQRNKLLVQTTGTLAVLLAAIMTLWTWWDFNRTIGDRALWWSAVNNTLQDGNLRRAIVQEGGAWHYDSDAVRVAGEGYSPADFLRKSADEADHRVEPRNLMRVVAFFADPFGDYPTQEARDAHMMLLEFMVLQPLIHAARARLVGESDWSADDGGAAAPATQALAEMIRLEAIAGGRARMSDIRIDALLNYVLAPAHRAEASEVGNLQHALQTMQAWGKGREMAASLGAGEGGRNRDDILTALNAHERFWHEQLGSLAGGPFEKINQVETRAHQFHQHEDQLLALANASITTQGWSESFGHLIDAAEKLRSAVEPTGISSLVTAFEGAIDEVSRSCRAAYDIQRQAKGFDSHSSETTSHAHLDITDSGENEIDDVTDETIESARATGEIAKLLSYECKPPAVDEDRQQRWQVLDSTVLPAVVNGEQAFEHRTESYRCVNNLVEVENDEEFVMGAFRASLAQIDDSEQCNMPRISESMRDVLRERQERSHELVRAVVDYARERRRAQLYGRALRAYATRNIAGHVEENADEREIPRVPLSRVARDEGIRVFDRQYNPKAALAIFDDWNAIISGLNSHEHGTAVSSDWPDAERAVKRYDNEYRYYWKETVCDLVKVSASDYESWAEFYGTITALSARPDIVRRTLEDFARVRAEALRARVGGGEAPEHDLNLIKLEQHRESYETYRRNIAELPEAGIRVVDRFAKMTNPVHIDPYVLFNTESASDDCIIDGYFRSIQTNKFRILAEEARGPVEAARRELRRDDRQRFPVVWDPRGETELTLDALLRVREAAQYLAGRADPGASEPLSTDIREIDEQLRIIRGEDGAVRRDDHDVIRAIRMITDVFGNEELTITIKRLNDPALDTGGAVSAANVFQLFSLHQQERELLHRRTDSRVGEDGIELTVHPKHPLVFSFSTIDDPPTEISERRNWALARMIQNDGKPDERIGNRDTGYTTWHLPVRGRHDNRDLIFWITVQFESPLPHPNDWPTRTRWPRI